MGKEFSRLYQFVMPEIFGLEKVPVLEKWVSEAPLVLSQSSLERAANYIKNSGGDGQSEYLKNFDPLKQQVSTWAGIIFHRIAQIIPIWQGALPYETKNYQQHYRQNLNQLIPQYNPTSKIKDNRTIHYFLDDDRFMMPRCCDNQQWQVTAKKNILTLLTDKVLSWYKTRYPFTSTLPLDQKRQIIEEGLTGINPADFSRHWKEHETDTLLHERVSHLLKYFETENYPRVIMGRNSPGSFGSEIRYSMFIKKLNLIWAGRLDEVSIAHNLDGQHFIHVSDYKINRAHLMPENSVERVIQRLAIHLTALAAYSLPEKFPTNGKSLELKPKGRDKNTHIFINYLGFVSSPPVKLDFTSMWSSDWKGSGHDRISELTDITTKIRSDPQLMTLVKR